MRTFVRESGEFFLTDELRHASGRRDIPSGQRSQAGCVKISYLTLNGDLLTVLVDQEHHSGGRIHSQPSKHGFELVILALV
jgi:hypothetical protein